MHPRRNTGPVLPKCVDPHAGCGAAVETHILQVACAQQHAVGAPRHHQCVVDRVSSVLRPRAAQHRLKRHHSLGRAAARVLRAPVPLPVETPHHLGQRRVGRPGGGVPDPPLLPPQPKARLAAVPRRQHARPGEGGLVLDGRLRHGHRGGVAKHVGQGGEGEAQGREEGGGVEDEEGVAIPRRAPRARSPPHLQEARSGRAPEGGGVVGGSVGGLAAQTVPGLAD
mmetsp:Transcript_42087/g.97564  ORF Transcript_42087/g.97564 Transcript_42087/m.97564 type:complete len:225 (-) Transcript_42087:101-775(-)